MCSLLQVIHLTGFYFPLHSFHFNKDLRFCSCLTCRADINMLLYSVCHCFVESGGGVLLSGYRDFQLLGLNMMMSGVRAGFVWWVGAVYLKKCTVSTVTDNLSYCTFYRDEDFSQTSMTSLTVGSTGQLRQRWSSFDDVFQQQLENLIFCSWF